MGFSDWIGNNAGWLGPALDVVGNLGSHYTSSGNRDSYFDKLREAETANYNTAKANSDAYAAWAGGQQAGAQGAANAQAAAANQNDAARREWAKKAFKRSKKFYKEAKGVFQPYHDTAMQLMPQMSQAYTSGLGLLNNMSQFVQSPESMKKLSGSVPASSIDPGLPEYLRYGK